ncbi:hypothetical protein ANCCEY_05531 [Ancylostoma ceylanicum]|uniref:BCL-11A-like CCHC zinc finger domain-containing protein n=1 Tax=Ancylostoma ceylanicum TaxID=53326 RepID=A0A0D6M673_9BILA|nr:hypothetical protein ANCCEY_05531 [Ancylostoma ceylanicum]
MSCAPLVLIAVNAPGRKTTKSCPLTVLDGIAEVSDDGRRRRKNACEADNETLKESGGTPMASSDSGVESAAEVDLTEMKATDSPMSRGASSPRDRCDLLLCGDCHAQFPIAHFSTFIEHKVSNCGGKSTPSEVDERPSRRRNFSHGLSRCVRSSSANPLMLDYHMGNMDVTTDTDDLEAEPNMSLFCHGARPVDLLRGPSSYVTREEGGPLHIFEKSSSPARPSNRALQRTLRKPVDSADMCVLDELGEARVGIPPAGAFVRLRMMREFHDGH